MSDQPLQTVPEVEPVASGIDATPPPSYCGNCQSPLLGDYCYRCGQSEKSMVRSLHVIGADLVDLVFNVDSRIFRSMFDLYFKPGFLTTEYFAGRRVRYVSPFRLFFFASLVAFFVVQSSIDFKAMNGALDLASVLDQNELPKAETAAQALQDLGNQDPPGRVGLIVANAERQVRAEITRGQEAQQKLLETGKSVREGVNEASRALQKIGNQPNLPPLVSDIVTEAQQGAEKAAERERLKQEAREKKRQQAEATAAGGTASPTDKKDNDKDLNFQLGGKPWDPAINPVQFALLPAAANSRINATLGHMRDNIYAMQNEPARVSQFIANAWSVFPQTLFFMMPFFALLLKLVFIFKRRLYMEHLIIALHSHGFIFQSMLVITLLTMLQTWLLTVAVWLGTGIGFLITAAWVWLPLYLLWMQKRVYRQGWIVASLTYSVIGICYTVLLSFGLVVAFAIALAAD